VAEPPTRASAPNLVSLFSDADYPAAAIRNHEEGAVGYRLSVGSDGHPIGCVVTSSSGSSILDSTTCSLLMERARFRPALDSAGKPTTDSLTGRIVWRLPGEDDFSPRVRAAQTLWSSCLLGEAAKLALGDLPDEEAVRRSFGPCFALETVLARETGASLPLGEMRSALLPGLAGILAELRAGLRAPIAPPAR
jgi:TonB family protein